MLKIPSGTDFHIWQAFPNICSTYHPGQSRSPFLSLCIDKIVLPCWWQKQKKKTFCYSLFASGAAVSLTSPFVCPTYPTVGWRGGGENIWHRVRMAVYLEGARKSYQTGDTRVRAEFTEDSRRHVLVIHLVCSRRLIDSVKCYALLTLINWNLK